MPVPAPRRLVPGLVRGAAVAVAYLVAVWISRGISVPPLRVAPIRPPQGVYLTALLLTPVSKWWVIIVTLLPINLFGVGGNIVIGAQYFVANSLEALFAASASR